MQSKHAQVNKKCSVIDGEGAQLIRTSKNISVESSKKHRVFWQKSGVDLTLLQKQALVYSVQSWKP